MDAYKIALSAGDTVGEELICQVRKLFRAVERKYDARFELVEIVSCGPAVEQYGTALRAEDISAAADCRAILFGNIGSGKNYGPEKEKSSVYALTTMRKAFNVCANIRPAYISAAFASLSPLRPEIIQKGLDILVVRDLMGGMIAGERHQQEGPGGREASDLEYYNEQIIARSARFAYASAMERRRKVTSVDKANVLASSKLWRQKVSEMQADFQTVELTHDYVDHMAMELLAAPEKFDVLLASNVFGDILSDEIAQITGAPWMFGSAELAEDGRGVYTPNQLHHPRGDELVGKGAICPYGILDAVSLLLRYSCGRPDLAAKVDEAIKQTLEKHLFTAEAVPDGGVIVSTDELGSEVAAAI